MNPKCRYCPNETMDKHTRCYPCFVQGPDADEEEMELLAALEDLPFSAPVDDADYPPDAAYEA